MPTALVFTHVAFEDLGSLAQELAARQFTVEAVDVCTADLLELDFMTPDLLVVMGGPIGVYETAAYPFLNIEVRRLRDRLKAGRATLGICLGAQLMAAALGAPVYPGKQGKEIGWSALMPGREIAACPPLGEFLAHAPDVLHWHGDTFDLPLGGRTSGSHSSLSQSGMVTGRVHSRDAVPSGSIVGESGALVRGACL